MYTNIVFMGSPEFAVPSLRALKKNFTIRGVVTQPDRKAGRGRKLTPPPVKLVAQEEDVPIIQPENVNHPKTLEEIRSWDPEVIVVAAFGQILKRSLLDLPPSGCINVHASLLPRWRGAAPIPAAILNGDDNTGITIMQMDEGVDTGPIIGQCQMQIHRDDTTESLEPRLADLGAKELLETLPRYLSGKLSSVPQDSTYATYAPMLNKKDGRLDFESSAFVLARKVRAYHPWPGVFFDWKGKRIKVLKATAVLNTEKQLTPGERTVHRKSPAIGTSHGILVLDKVQPAGKIPTEGKNFLLGAKDWNS